MPAAKAADADRQHHVAELAHGRVGEHLLDVVLGQPDGGAKIAVRPPTVRHHQQGRRREHVEGAHARHHVDAGRHHGGGVDQRAHRRGAGHRVRQPDVERNLRALARGADEQADADPVEQGQAEHDLALEQMHRFADAPEAQGAGAHALETPEQQQHADQEAEVADAIDDEGLVARRRVGQVAEPEADQQIGTEPDALPADEHQQQVVAEHQQQHREAEQVHVGEEAPDAVVALHVADRVDVDEQAHPRHHEQHHAAQGIEGEGDRDIQPRQRAPTHADPAPELLGDHPALGGQAAQVEEAGEREQEAAGNRPHGQALHEARRELAAEQDVHAEAEQGQEGNPAQGSFDPAQIHTCVLPCPAGRRPAPRQRWSESRWLASMSRRF